MNYRRFLIAALVLVGGVAFCLGQTTAPAPESANLLPNGGFEDWGEDGKLPEHWTSNQPGLIKPDEDPERGPVVQIKAPKRALEYFGVTLVSADQLTLEPGARYRCTGVVRSTGPRLQLLVEGCATIDRMVRGEMQTADEPVFAGEQWNCAGEQWQPFALDCVMPAAVEFGEQRFDIKFARVTLWTYGLPGVLWIDDLRLCKLPDGAAAAPPGDSPVRFEVPDAAGGRWLEASKAFEVADYGRAVMLTEDRLVDSPTSGDFRLLLARTFLRLQRWPAAMAQLEWLAAGPSTTQPAREVEPWQVEWVPVLRAEVLWHLGRVDAARAELAPALRPNVSLRVRRAAETLERQIDISQRKRG